MTFKDLEKTITKAELFKKYKSKEIGFAVCFVVADDGELLCDVPTTFHTSLTEAEAEAKNFHESVFVYTRKYAKDCFDPDALYEDLTNNVYEEGFTFPYSVEAKKEFERITRRWFNKQVGNAWFADEFIGKLVE